MIDFLIVGAGLTGATLAQQLHAAGKTVRVIEKRAHIGGNCYTEYVGNTIVCKYGGHIFHTNSRRIWNYVNRFAEWQQYSHYVMTSYKGRVYSFPPNLMTYVNMGLKPGAEADEAIRRTFFEGYTAKQWGREINEIPASYIRRIPYRRTWDNRYYDAAYQGLPEGGFTPMIAAMLEGIPVELGRRATWTDIEKATHTIWTGPLDELFGYDAGDLEYRSLHFEEVDTPGFDQGCPTMNYADREIPYTRIMQWRYWWRTTRTPHNISTVEYPMVYNRGGEPYYPVETPPNRAMHERYEKRLPGNVLPAGRLGAYRYYDMDQAIGAALALSERLKR